MFKILTCEIWQFHRAHNAMLIHTSLGPVILPSNAPADPREFQVTSPVPQHSAFLLKSAKVWKVNFMVILFIT